MGSAWVPHGFGAGSKMVKTLAKTTSAWVPHGFCTGSGPGRMWEKNIASKKRRLVPPSLGVVGEFRTPQGSEKTLSLARKNSNV